MICFWLYVHCLCRRYLLTEVCLMGQVPVSPKLLPLVLTASISGLSDVIAGSYGEYDQSGHRARVVQTSQGKASADVPLKMLRNVIHQSEFFHQLTELILSTI